MWILDDLKNMKDCNRIAVIHREQSISFCNLWKYSEILANWMNVNLKTKNPVIIYGNKDIDIIVIMIAALKTGRPYVPVDITFPVERLHKIAEMTDAEVIFNFSSIYLPYDKHKVIDVEQINSIKKEKFVDMTDENHWVKSNDICYILFTSGSTGEPKGVQITKKNITNFVNWFGNTCDLSEKAVVLNQISYSFDVSVIQIYIYLAKGYTLFNIDKGMIEDLNELFRYLKGSNVASWISTPAFIEICTADNSFNKCLLPNLKKVILAGEVLTKTLVNTLYEKFPEIEVYNGYGPTECTVLLSFCRINEEMMCSSKNLPIGHIISDANYWIEDKEGNMVSEGESGELVVVSDSVSKGYYNNKEITERVFFIKDNRNGYRTGDIVYVCDSLLYYCGRKDSQIKLNGYRIELNDISNNLNKLDCIKSSVVLPVKIDERVAYIVAFVALNYELGLSHVKTTIFIKKQLKDLIPSYMVPRKIVVIEDFPLNTNGKIDRKKLLETYL